MNQNTSNIKNLYRLSLAGICIPLFFFIQNPSGLADLTNNTDYTLFTVPDITSSSGQQDQIYQKIEHSIFQDEDALARISVSGTINEINLPIYAHLLGSNGYDYVLVKASPSELIASGLPYNILDPEAGGRTYAIASRYTNQTKQEITAVATILFDDGKNLVLKTDPDRAEHLLAAGLDIRWFDTTPMVIREPGPAMAEEEPEITYDSCIANMTNQVNRDDLYSIVGSLSGEEPVMVDGKNYTILTRLTESGEPIHIATQYVYELLHGLNLSVSNFNWFMWHRSCRNIIATKVGTTRPDEIVLVTAHLDSYSDSEIAPGADDDASGSAAVLAFAKIMDNYRFERTIRYVLFTGEEQGLLGSQEYANVIARKGEKVVAVFNMDMISWDRSNGPVMSIHTRIPSDPGGYADDMVIARTFNESITLYGMRQNLTPVIISDGDEYSDHFSFWNRGYPAVLAIEDDYDFTPYYHTDKDRRESLNMDYYTNFAKASIATVAHLASPSDPAKESLFARFMADITKGTPPMEVQFTDFSSGQPTHWNWTFGDGSVSHIKNPVHQYQGIGRYTVTLEVANRTDQAIVRIPEYILVHSGRIVGPNGMIQITSSPPWARVYLDDEYIGETPLSVSGISAGVHKLWLMYYGYRDWTGEVEVYPGTYTFVPNIILRPDS